MAASTYPQVSVMGDTGETAKSLKPPASLSFTVMPRAPRAVVTGTTAMIPATIQRSMTFAALGALRSLTKALLRKAM